MKTFIHKQLQTHKANCHRRINDLLWSIVHWDYFHWRFAHGLNERLSVSAACQQAAPAVGHQVILLKWFLATLSIWVPVKSCQGNFLGNAFFTKVHPTVLSCTGHVYLKHTIFLLSHSICGNLIPDSDSFNEMHIVPLWNSLFWSRRFLIHINWQDHTLIWVAVCNIIMKQK